MEKPTHITNDTYEAPLDIPILPDVPIGPNGKEPSLILPRILNFLLDEDIYRHPGWPTHIKVISKYLKEADDARLRGELGYNDTRIRALLEDTLILVDVHRNFHEWKTGTTRWSMNTLRGPPSSVRLPTFPSQFIRSATDKSRYKRKRLDYLPRSIRAEGLFPPVSKRGSAVVDYYQAAEELFFEDCLSPQSSKANVFNGFRVDNEEYERCIKGGLAGTYDSVPAILAANVPIPAEEDSTAVRDRQNEFYVARGWQRAALQHCLNMFTNHENRVINTPWRRVVLPLKEPESMAKEVVYYPRSLPPDKVPNHYKEPYPWTYWFSQHQELIDILAGWQRRRYNLENWFNFSRSALPVNFHGPHVNRGLSIYEEYWLGMGAYLKRLRKLMTDTFGIAPRPFMVAILRDIQAGIEWRPDPASSSKGWRPDQAETRRQARPDIMRRQGVDWVDKRELIGGPEISLIDEADAAWLRFLCQPSRTPEMCDPEKQPKDNLTILFDARLNEFLNNPSVSDSPGSGGPDMFNPDLQGWHRGREATRPTFDQALAYINGGGGTGESDTNETYQFTRAEAQLYMSRLRSLGRVQYVDRFDEKTGEVLEGATAIVRPNYRIHPEHRVYWRHESNQSFTAYQTLYRNRILEHLMHTYKLNEPATAATEEEFRYILDHLGATTLPVHLAKAKLGSDTDVASIDLLRPIIHPENGWIKGSYQKDGLEDIREAPSWSDLVDFKTLGALPFDDAYGLPVPERTSQFFRNLAYRMGRTIAHAEEIERSHRYSSSGNLPNDASGTEAEAGRWKPISVNNFKMARDHWEQSIAYGVGAIPFKPPRIEAIVDKADTAGTYRKQFPNQHASTIIREGIINDCVRNYNTMYPGRVTVLEDSSGYYTGDYDYERDKLLGGKKRPSLFKWATKAQRQYQAPFTRFAFFDMRRWPLHRQPPERREFIAKREDQIKKRNPGLEAQARGILLPRIPGQLEKHLLYGSTYSFPENLGTKPTTSDAGTKAPLGRKGRGWTKAPEKTNTSYGTKGPWKIKPIPSTKTSVKTSTQQAPSETPREASQQTPPSLPQEVPQEVIQETPSEVLQTIPQEAVQVPQEVPQVPRANLQGPLEKVFQDIPQYGSLFGPQGAIQDIPREVIQQPPQQIPQQTPQEITPGFTQEFTQGFTQGFTQEITQEITQGTFQEAAEEPLAVTESEQTSSTDQSDDGSDMAATAETTTEQGKLELVSIRRPDYRFIPGPAVFPMAETLLQSVALSQQLEEVLYPEPPLNLWGKIRKYYKQATDVRPPQIPLLPSTDLWETPRSSSRKRKIPAEFILPLGKGIAKRPKTQATGGQGTSAIHVPAPDEAKVLDGARAPTSARLPPPATKPAGSQGPVQGPTPPISGIGQPVQVPTQQPVSLGRTPLGQTPPVSLSSGLSQPIKAPVQQGVYQGPTPPVSVNSGRGQGQRRQVHWSDLPAPPQNPAGQPASHPQALPPQIPTPASGSFQGPISSASQFKPVSAQQLFPTPPAAPPAAPGTSDMPPERFSPLLNRDFPTGWQTLNLVPGFEGAVQAVVNSMRLQSPSSTVIPSADDLRAALQDPGCEFSDKNTGDMNRHPSVVIAQANAALLHYTRAQSGTNQWVRLHWVTRVGGQFTAAAVNRASDAYANDPRVLRVWVFCTGKNEFAAIFPRKS